MNKKFIKLGIIFILAFIFVYILATKFIFKTKKVQPVPSLPPNISQNVPVNPSANNKPLPSDQTSNQPTVQQASSNHSNNNAASNTLNPFVYLKNSKSTVPQSEIFAGANRPVTQLPEIPAVSSNIPPVGSVPVPEIPEFNGGNPNSPSNARSAQIAVKGVFIGSDGKNTAVMSDGSIVSEGDNYQDGRIAYIGGDGIHFDDGKHLKYGE